ncbi:MAG: response regulator transcription factor [Microcoleaceae cyanobacterium]
MRILLVDDEVELTEPLGRVLRREGYTVDVADNGSTGLDLAMQTDYDLLILDWMLPQKSGIEICQELRSPASPAQSHQTPILFLTAKDTLNDRVEGLDAGADDYLVKPFELRELLARVRALLRRLPTSAPGPQVAAASGSTAVDSVAPASRSSTNVPTTSQHNRLQVADLELEIPTQQAYRGKRAINLSEKETQLLAYLMQNSRQLLTHQQIQEFLWPGDQKPSSNVLAAQVRLLRRKIEQPGETALIHTIYGKGYRFGE